MLVDVVGIVVVNAEFVMALFVLKNDANDDPIRSKSIGSENVKEEEKDVSKYRGRCFCCSRLRCRLVLLF